MAIHNEVMPEMTRIFRLQKKLKILIDSLQSEGTIATFSVDSLQKLNDDLQKADKAMMNCKRFSEFQVEGKQHEEIIEALVSEKESVIVVREKMLDSIQKAEDILQYIETP
ncbi:hypothetical protein WJR50_17280 [Catalinimonas sp. 4WD22]|uniref:hypothetical protein n=1 Tax=Catalinimonas locisalis TaxID=3133978 RepID=UPI003101087F